MTAIRGHGLINEGVGYSPSVPPETLLRRYWYSAHDVNGVAVCRCGAVSPPLPSNAARKRWHKAHKADVAGGVA
jgi:hypothetical protein